MDVVGSHGVVEDGDTVAFLAFKEHVDENLTVIGCLQKKCFVVATGREMIDVDLPVGSDPSKYLIFLIL